MKWKQIKGYEGLYEVSEYGDVRSIDREVRSSKGPFQLKKGKNLSRRKNKFGYIVYDLSKDNIKKQFKAHRLVAVAFIGDSNLHVNHKDMNKENNHYSNLEFVTIKENIRHARINGKRKNQSDENHPMSKLSNKQRGEIVDLILKGVLQKTIADKYKVHLGTVERIYRKYKLLNTN